MMHSYFGQDVAKERNKAEEKKKIQPEKIKSKNVEITQQKKNVDHPKKILEIRKVHKRNNNLTIVENQVSIQEQRSRKYE